jgi:hypothetical protein
MPSGPWGAETGRDDAGFIARLRELLRDYPIRAVEQVSPNGTSTEVKCTQTLINDDKYLQITNNGTNVPVVFDRSLVAPGNAYVDCNTGWILFGTAPSAGTNTLIIYKNKVRWRDSAILQALYGGLLFLYPKRFREATDTSITMATNVWDYTLPSDFTIPDIYIRNVQIREIPSTTNRFRTITGWQRNGTDFRFARSQRFSVGATVEIQYTAPYRSLSDVDDIASEVPIWYAAAQLQGFEESRRTQINSQSTDANSNAMPPGFQQQTAAWYMAQATNIRNSIQRAIPWSRAKSTLDI